MNSLPVIAIVGRPNVGKSSLLNALVGKRVSIVQDMPGVTRDRVSMPLQVDGRYVELVDTGGYGFVDPDQLTEHIQHQIELAMSRADLVLFIVDCQDGLTVADEEMASLLRHRGARTVLVANKADGPKADVVLGDFARLGLGTPIGVSALAGRNLDEVVQAIAQNVDLKSAPEQIPEPQMLLAIVGKRNAGKSTLVNAIARIYEDDPDRVIVSEVPGTTRDSIDVRFEKDGKALVVIDTAGVRKKRQMATHDIEFYSFHRAQRSIRRADVVIMLVDGTEPLSEPDKKLAQYIAEQHKPVLLVVNKWDLTRQKVREVRKLPQEAALRDDEVMQEYRDYLAAELPWLDYAPVAFVTAKDERNVQGVLDVSQRLFKQACERLTTGRLNAAISQVFEERAPSTPSGHRARVYYATQVETAPPTIVLFVNNPQYVNESYQRFLVNRLRELLPFAEVPIRLIIRARGERGGTMPSEPAPDQRHAPKAGAGARRAGSRRAAGRKPSGPPRAGKAQKTSAKGRQRRH